ncbi:MFS transporter [Paenibacillus sp. HWE-109]|uniref:MFS transporter n=1 Tax=Paenibacillus sp. HWE-109 TaxID=1306526 RepID=UPI001EDF848C|nr:MFS transporter [Paenibacillus sp. HWE-109]UKS24191.1 MFS transporter [Paenibacillus sp. HWE-109]
MNRMTIYMLTIGVFLTATAELIVSGILTYIAEDLHVSLALAGQLITAYSLSFAVGTPILVSLTSRMGRRKVLIGSLFVFIMGSLLSAMSTTFILLMLSRVVLGISAGVYFVTVFGAVAKLVIPEKLGSAIGTIVLGFSTAMILGVPMGILITKWLSWQAIFVILSLLSLLIAYSIYRLVPEIEGDAPISFMKQFKVLGSFAIVSGLFITLFKESGSSILFTYMTPFMQEILGLKATAISFLMLVLGVVGSIGSKFGGYGVDKWGAARMVSMSLIVQITAAALLPIAVGSLPLSLLLIGFIVLSMFVSGPAVQSYFIQQAPQSANLVLSLNTSIVHLGLAAGAGAGGYLLDSTSTLLYHPWLAGIVLMLGLTAAIYSFYPRHNRKTTWSAK